MFDNVKNNYSNCSPISRRYLPNMPLPVREEQSCINTISRLKRGRAMKNRRNTESPKLPSITKRVRFMSCKGPSKADYYECNPKIGGSLNLSGRFPSVAVNRITLNKDGNLSIVKNRKKASSDVYLDLFNLPPAPNPLRILNNLSSLQCSRKRRPTSKVHVIRESDLDELMSVFIPQQYRFCQNNPISIAKDHSCMNLTANLLLKPKYKPVLVATTGYLEELWLRKYQEVYKMEN